MGIRSPGEGVRKAMRNINEILDIHENLLSLMRPFVTLQIPRTVQSIARDDAALRPRTRGRSKSVDDPEFRYVKASMIARMSLDAPKSGKNQDSRPTSLTSDAAEIARAFEHSVSKDLGVCVTEWYI